MLVSTLDSYKKTARLDHYYVAGKTGTAQIATRGGYDTNGATNHTLVGFGPADDPRLVIVVKYGDMSSSSSYRWAESTTGPVFRDVMKFALDYYQIPAQR
jgi:cell division protein FtsI/penicillin-binding protein 2